MDSKKIEFWNFDDIRFNDEKPIFKYCFYTKIRWPQLGLRPIFDNKFDDVIEITKFLILRIHE